MAEISQVCKNCKRDITCNFDIHAAYCERNIKLCDLCEQPIKISEFKQHLEEDHVMIACDRCDKSLEKWMLLEHKESCSKRLVPCQFCEAEFPFDVYVDEHVDACGSRTEKCIHCRKFIMLKDLDRHTKAHLTSKEKIRQEKTSQHKVKQELNSEIIQNAMNEHISKTQLPVPAKFNKNAIDIEHDACESQKRYYERKSLKERTSESFDEDMHGKYFNSLEFAGAAECPSNKSEAFSRRYGKCPICKKDIPWVDMNIHMPTCATDAGKCSRCHKDVPSEQIKDHILKYCPELHRKDQRVYETDREKKKVIPFNDPMYLGGYEADETESKKCPFCSQFCSENHILDHIRNCDKNIYECPLCGDKLPEKDKEKHEKYYCRILIEIQEEKPFLASSYAETVKNSPSRGKTAHQNNFVNCLKCKNNVSKQKYTEHFQNCQYLFSNETVNSNPRNCQQPKGAIPKQTYRKASVGKCCYCGTIYNADVLQYHEQECVHQSILCETCGTRVAIKDLDSHGEHHFSKNNKRSKHKGKSANTEKGFLNKISSFLKRDSKSIPENPQQMYGYPADACLENYQEQQYYRRTPTIYAGEFESMYYEPSNIQIQVKPEPEPKTEKMLLPCEFCEEVLYDEFSLIAHMSGEHANEVSYVKPESPPTKDDGKSVPQSFFESPRISQEPSKRHARRHPEETETRAGEFLSQTNQDTENETFVDAVQDLPGFQSFWNAESPLVDSKNQFPTYPSQSVKGILDSFELTKDPSQKLKVKVDKTESFKQTQGEILKSFYRKVDETSQNSDMDISPSLSDEEMKQCEATKISQPNNTKIKLMKSAEIQSYENFSDNSFENKFQKEASNQHSSAKNKLDDIEKMDDNGSSTEDLHEIIYSDENIDLKKASIENKNMKAVPFDSSDDDVNCRTTALSCYKFSDAGNETAKQKRNFNRGSTEKSHVSDLGILNSKSKKKHPKQFLENESSTKISSYSKSSSIDDGKINKLVFDANKKVLDLYGSEVTSQHSKSKCSVKISADESSLNKDSKMLRPYCDAYRKQLLQQNKIGAMHNSDSSDRFYTKYLSRQTVNFKSPNVVEDKTSEMIYKQTSHYKIPVEVLNNDSENSSNEEDIKGNKLSTEQGVHETDLTESYINRNSATKDMQHGLASNCKAVLEEYQFELDSNSEDLKETELDDFNSFEHIEIEELKEEKFKIDVNLRENFSADNTSDSTGFQRTMHNIKAGAIQIKECGNYEVPIKTLSSSNPLENHILKTSKAKCSEKKSLNDEAKVENQTGARLLVNSRKTDFQQSHQEQRDAQIHKMSYKDISSEEYLRPLFPEIFKENQVEEGSTEDRTTGDDRQAFKIESSESRSFIASRNTYLQQSHPEQDDTNKVICKKISSDEYLRQRFPELFPGNEKSKENQVKECLTEDRIPGDDRQPFKIESALLRSQVSGNTQSMKQYLDQVNTHANKVMVKNMSSDGYFEKRLSNMGFQDKQLAGAKENENLTRVPSFLNDGLPKNMNMMEIVDNLKKSIDFAKSAIDQVTNEPCKLDVTKEEAKKYETLSQLKKIDSQDSDCD